MNAQTPWQYQFPAISRSIPTDCVTRQSQCFKILEESREVLSEAWADTLNESDYIMELMDVIHACETALREFDRDAIDEAKHAVIAKNEVRGYYGGTV